MTRKPKAKKLTKDQKDTIRLVIVLSGLVLSVLALILIGV